MLCCSPFDEANLKGIMVQSSEGGLTQKGFASCWAYLTIVNPRKALEHMMYLGLPMDPAVLQRQFAISKTRQQERRRGKDFQGRALFQVCCRSWTVTMSVLCAFHHGAWLSAMLHQTCLSAQHASQQA